MKRLSAPWMSIGALVVLCALVIGRDAMPAQAQAQAQATTSPAASQEDGTANQRRPAPQPVAGQAPRPEAPVSDRDETSDDVVDQHQRVPPASMFFGLQEAMYILRNRFREMISALPELPSIGPFMVARITKGYEPSHIWAIGGYLLVIFVGAFAGEAALRRMFRPLERQLSRPQARSDFRKLGILLLRAFISLLAVAAFAATAIIVFFFVFKGHEVARIAFWSIFAFFILVRVIAVALEVILSVQQPALRLPNLDDAAARRLYVGLLSLIGLAVGSAIFGNFLTHIGVAPGQMLAVNEGLLLANVVVQVLVIWAQRADINRLLADGSAETASDAKDFEGLFSRYWHMFAVTLLILIAVVSTVHRLLTGETQSARVFPTLAVLIAVPMVDGLLRMICRQYFAAPGNGLETRVDAPRMDDSDSPVDRQGESPSSEAVDAPMSRDGGTDRGTDYGRVVLRNGRILLALVSVIVLAEIWDVHLQAMATQGIGARVAGSLFDIIVTLTLASAAWGIVKTAINRQLPHEGLDALALAEGEIGGTGLSRLETLLPLLRKFLYITLLVIVGMIVISSLGINIGPLLAGAGVVGIAVGFGAQTLVRDVISGVFFLIDDAFRVGEYIDVGEGKGTVERMSVRSLMLRHHLGQINTIPFGAIRRVTNYSRDWAIMKLEMRVPFDTDLEKLRKIVKRVGAEMMADPMYGPNFIQPVKSQGVHHMDDSSFIIRVKFMAKPGEQFVLRREVFRRLQEAFQANDIRFAPRRVIVDSTLAPEAAAAAVAAADEQGRASSGS